MTDYRAALQDGLTDRYRLEHELGRGGMATVYLAHDLRHDRPVALKVLHPDLAHAVGAERFQREIQVAARLQHPHILTVLDSGESAGQLWFTMPYVEGESLRTRLDREKQLPVDEAVRIAREAADALDYAHRRGIVHRDIKPDNILLSDGHALVADFGIARALAPGSEQLTATGTSVGTAAYMSPEQAAGERDVDARSDIYSLGIVLYEMLAGDTPFAAATPQATIARRFTEHPRPVRTVRDAVPESLDRVMARALARTAADRYPTARAFADALAPSTYSTASTASTDSTAPTASTATPMERMRRVPGLALLVIGLVIGGGLLFAWTRASEDASSAADIRSASAEPSAVRVAVLPFENLGDTADAYFAEGLTEALRGKLAAIGGLEVIARSSSEEYVGTTKGPGQIADELGVDYLLLGRVRWVKLPDGTSRVQVSPELVEVADGSARTRWSQPFDAPLTDVFAVQGEIAGRVSSALDVALGASDRQRLAERPTEDLAAYDAYLHAQAISGSDPASARRVAALLEEAVAHDSSFGAAWASLATARAYLWASATIKPSEAEVRRALDRAMTLAPDAPVTYGARISYARNVERDMAKARQIGEEAMARYPAEADLMHNHGLTLLLGDHPEPAVTTLRRAAALDPRNADLLTSLAAALLQLGRWSEARDVLHHILAMVPGDISATHHLVRTWLGEGDLAGARRALNASTPSHGRGALLAYTTLYGDFYWVLDRAQQDTVLGMDVEAFDGDAGSRALVFAQIHRQRGDTAAARRWAELARRELQALGLEPSDDPQITALIGLAYALEGRHGEARSWLERAAAESRGKDPTSYRYALELLGHALVLSGEHEEALTALARAIELRGPEGRGVARLHPDFAPLRGDPRFERITAEPGASVQ